MKRSDLKPQSQESGTFRYIPNRTWDPRKKEAEREKYLRELSREANKDPLNLIGVFSNFETGEVEFHEMEFPLGSAVCYQSENEHGGLYQRFFRKFDNLLVMQQIKLYYTPKQVAEKIADEIRSGNWAPDLNNLEHHKRLTWQDYWAEKKLVEAIDFFETRHGNRISENEFFNILMNFEL